MATPVVFKNAEIYLGGVELTGQQNQVGMDYSVEPLDNTVFGASTRTKTGGLRDAAARGRGFYQAGSNGVDPTLFDGVGVADAVLTVFPDGITEGSTSTGVGYSFKVTQSRLTFGATIGELLPFDFEALGRGISA